jgi:hypothetical protein
VKHAARLEHHFPQGGGRLGLLSELEVIVHMMRRAVVVRMHFGVGHGYSSLLQIRYL